MKRSLAILFLIIGSLANAKDYELLEIGTLSVSGDWFPIDASITNAQNDDLVRHRPQTTTRYLLGFTRGKPPKDFYSSSEYLWIQKTPISTPPTPEQLTAMVPKTVSKNKPELERALKDKIQSIDTGAAHYDQRLNAVVWDANPTLADGSIARSRSYIIITKTSLVAVGAYSTAEKADIVFEEVQGIVSTLKVKEDQRMPPSWTERVKQLFGGAH
jgi:hypothetical protein